MSQVLLFTSLKGGVGKTTAAASLAFALSFYRKRVLCVDLDFGVRGLDLALGAENACGEDVLEVIRSGDDPASQALKLSENLFFLSAPALYNTRQGCELTSADLSAFLHRAKQSFDMILLDLAAGGGELFLPLVNSPEVTDTVVVSTAEAMALRAAEQTGYEIRAASDARVRLILNRCPVRKKVLERNLFEMARDAAIPVLGVVPEDTFAKETDGCGIPLSRLPQSMAGRAYWNIAARLLGEDVPLFHSVLSPGRKKQLFRFRKTQTDCLK